jgi:hypothetical protein
LLLFAPFQPHAPNPMLSYCFARFYRTQPKGVLLQPG